MAAALRKVRSGADVVDIPVLGGLGTLLMGRAPEEVEEWSYGNAPVRINPYAGRTASFVPEVKPGRAEQLADTLLLGVDAAPVAKLAGKYAAGAAKRAADVNAIRDYVRSAQGLPGVQVVKPKGGNWLAGSVEKVIEPLKSRVIGRDPAERLAEIERMYATSNLDRLPENLKNLYTGQFEREIRRLKPEVAINQWLDQKLAKYIRNEMASPEDPLRLQADAFSVKKAEMLSAKDAQLQKAMADLERARAERGVTPEMLTSSQARVRQLRKEKANIEAQTGLHFTPEDVWLESDTAWARQEAGFPRHGMAKGQTATDWEVLSDKAAMPVEAGDARTGIDAAFGLLSANPWLEKVGKDVPVYGTELRRGVEDRLGFSHLTDELRNALNPESGLPEALRIAPEKLAKMNVAQVAKLVDDINAYRAGAKAEANAARAGNVATHTFKEYPEGYRWVELKVPEPKLGEGETVRHLPEVDMWGIYDPRGGAISSGATEREAMGLLRRQERQAALEDALKYEGEVMGHCVGGYCPDVVEGRSRIFSLRDAEGKPYTTVEVNPSRMTPYDYWYATKDKGSPDVQEFLSWMSDQKPGPGGFDKWYERWAKETGREIERPPALIKQIKGPGNRAPAAEVLPYVQDFVKSGKWSDVKDLGNAGLTQLPDKRFITKEQFDEGVQRLAGEGEPGINAEWFRRQITRNPSWWENAKGAFEGYARGGAVVAPAAFRAYNSADIDALADRLAAELALN